MNDFNSFPPICKSCKYCQSFHLVESLKPFGSNHYGRLTCGDCDKFHKWIPKPKPAEISIVRLLQISGLGDWERRFLKAIVYQGSQGGWNLMS